MRYFYLYLKIIFRWEFWFSELHLELTDSELSRNLFLSKYIAKETRNIVSSTSDSSTPKTTCKPGATTFTPGSSCVAVDAGTHTHAIGCDHAGERIWKKVLDGKARNQKGQWTDRSRCLKILPTIYQKFGFSSHSFRPVMWAKCWLGNINKSTNKKRKFTFNSPLLDNADML